MPTTQESCCGKCKDRLGGNPELGFTRQCAFKGNCECHQKPDTSEPRVCTCPKGSTHWPGSPCVSPPTHDEGWQKDILALAKDPDCHDMLVGVVSRLLADQRERIAGEIERFRDSKMLSGSTKNFKEGLDYAASIARNTP